MEQSSASNWPVINAVVQADGNGRLEVAGIEESVSAGACRRRATRFASAQRCTRGRRYNGR